MGKPNNTVTIKGRLWKRPELKKLDSGLRLCNFHVIVDDSFLDEKTGEFANVFQLVPVTAFGDDAEKLKNKGDVNMGVKVVGHLKHEKYKDRLGNDQYVLKVLVSNSKDKIRMLFSNR